MGSGQWAVSGTAYHRTSDLVRARPRPRPTPTVGVSLALLAARVCGVEYRPAVVVAVGPGVALVVAMEAVGAIEVAWSRLGVGVGLG